MDNDYKINVVFGEFLSLMKSDQMQSQRPVMIAVESYRHHEPVKLNATLLSSAAAAQQLRR